MWGFKISLKKLFPRNAVGLGLPLLTLPTGTKYTKYKYMHAWVSGIDLKVVRKYGQRSGRNAPAPPILHGDWFALCTKINTDQVRLGLV